MRRALIGVHCLHPTRKGGFKSQRGLAYLMLEIDEFLRFESPRALGNRRVRHQLRRSQALIQYSGAARKACSSSCVVGKCGVA